MAIVGIVGGLGPESTIDYYRRLIEEWHRVDPSTAPSIVIDSLDVGRALHLVENDRPALIEYLLASLHRLAGAGVDFAAMSANTPHIVFDDLAARSPVPLLSIVEVCAAAACQQGLTRLALLGTRFTMEAPFYPDVFARAGMAVVLPDAAERAWVHEKYVGELLKGQFLDDTRQRFTSLVGRLRQSTGIDGVILGGTELPLLLPTPTIADVPALDTTALHVIAIIKRLQESDAPSLHDVELVSVLATGDAGLIAVAKSLLESEKIDYMVKGEGLQDLFGLGRLTGFSYAMGPAEFWVRRDDADRARALLQDLTSSEH